MKAVTLIVTLAAALCGQSARTTQQPPRDIRRQLREFSEAIEELARAASPAVVQINVRSRALVGGETARRAGFVAEEQATGSGVIVDADGYVVTNAHVVEGARRIDVSVLDPQGTDQIDDHKHFPGKVVGTDRQTDLAVLKIDAHNLPTLGFVKSDLLKQGQIVLALGSPLGLDNSLTVGFISAPIRHLKPESPMYYIQTDAPINPGNSGGPLLDTEGRITGINTMILSQSGGSEGIGFAIPSKIVRQVVSRLRAEGHVHRGAIGVIPEDITPVLASALGLGRHTGAILSDVAPHGAAEAAGLQTGDIVLAVNGTPVRAARQLAAAIFESSIGDELSLDVQRGDQKLQTKVTIMERPRSPAALSDLAGQDNNVVSRLGILALTVDEKVTAVLKDLRRLSGVAVAGIPAEYAAFNPGLAAGDVIYEFNGKPVGSLEELKDALAAKKPGDAAVLLVEREGQLIYVSFELE